MKILDVLFHRFFLFFSKRTFGAEDPFITTTFAVSASESFFLFFSFNIISAYFFCYDYVTKSNILLTGAIIFVTNYYIYVFRKKGKKVIRSKPKIFNSDRLSYWFSLLFFIFSNSMLFWAIPVLKKLISQCN